MATKGALDSKKRKLYSETLMKIQSLTQKKTATSLDDAQMIKLIGTLGSQKTPPKIPSDKAATPSPNKKQTSKLKPNLTIQSPKQALTKTPKQLTKNTPTFKPTLKQNSSVSQKQMIKPISRIRDIDRLYESQGDKYDGQPPLKKSRIEKIKGGSSKTSNKPDKFEAKAKSKQKPSGGDSTNKLQLHVTGLPSDGDKARFVLKMLYPDATNISIPKIKKKSKESGRFGFVSFSSPEKAKHFHDSTQGTEIGGCKLSVSFTKVSKNVVKNQEPSKTIDSEDISNEEEKCKKTDKVVGNIPDARKHKEVSKNVVKNPEPKKTIDNEDRRNEEVKYKKTDKLVGHIGYENRHKEEECDDPLRLYVTGLPQDKDIKMTELKRIFPEATNIAIKRRGRHQGPLCGFVSFASSEKAKQSCDKASKVCLWGKKLDVLFAKASLKLKYSQDQNYDPLRLFVAGFPQDTKVDELRLIFPEATDISILSRGPSYVIVSFDSWLTANKYHDEAQGVDLRGSSLVVAFAKKKKDQPQSAEAKKNHYQKVIVHRKYDDKESFKNDDEQKDCGDDSLESDQDDDDDDDDDDDESEDGEHQYSDYSDNSEDDDESDIDDNESGNNDIDQSDNIDDNEDSDNELGADSLDSDEE